MQVNVTKEDSKLTLAIEGRVDTVTAPALEAEIKNSIDGVKELILDFAEVSYISSAGLRVLLSAQKIMNKQGSMEIHHVNDMIMEIFEITGFEDILTIV